MRLQNPWPLSISITNRKASKRRQKGKPSSSLPGSKLMCCGVCRKKAIEAQLKAEQEEHEKRRVAINDLLAQTKDISSVLKTASSPAAAQVCNALFVTVRLIGCLLFAASAGDQQQIPRHGVVSESGTSGICDGQTEG